MTLAIFHICVAVVAWIFKTVYRLKNRGGVVHRFANPRTYPHSIYLLTPLRQHRRQFLAPLLTFRGGMTSQCHAEQASVLGTIERTHAAFRRRGRPRARGGRRRGRGGGGARGRRD